MDIQPASTDGFSALDGLSTLHGWTTDQLSALDDGPSTLDDDGLSTLHGWTTGLSTLDDGLSLQGLTTNGHPHTCTTLNLNLSGLSDIFDDLATALGDNVAKPRRGGSLSDQLQDEPGLFDALRDLGFEETTTGKNC